MADSHELIRAVGDEECGKWRSILPDKSVARGGWKGVDPLYVWSAAAGLIMALVLIAVAAAMQSVSLY